MLTIKFVIDETENLRATEIDFCDFGSNSRCKNALKRAHINTLGEALDKLDKLEQLRKSKAIKGLGTKAVEQLVLGIVKEHIGGMTDLERGMYFLRMAELNGLDIEAFLDAMEDCDD